MQKFLRKLLGIGPMEEKKSRKRHLSVKARENRRLAKIRTATKPFQPSGYIAVGSRWDVPLHLAVWIANKRMQITGLIAAWQYRQNRESAK